MSEFKFTDKERFEIQTALYEFGEDPNSSYGKFIDRIETILSKREQDGSNMSPEIEELVSMAERMQSLYRNGKFGLSDEEMTRAVAHLDDLRRIPSPPNPNK